MTPDEQQKVRAALLQLRADVIDEGAVDVKVERPEVLASSTDEDVAPYLEMGQAIASSRNKERGERVRRIEAALQRLADAPDDYGLCSTCGEEIPAGRLMIVPFATQCVPCQSQGEVRGGAVRKKVMDYR